MRIMFVVNDLGINEPFGPMILSAVLKQKGHETILGALQEEDVAEKVRRWKPDVLAYSMMSVDMIDFRKFNAEIKKERPGIFTLLGGAHATLDRHSCFPDPDLDAICVGEGEEAIAELVHRLDHGKSLEGAPNLMFDRDAELNLNRFIDDMDSIPFMDRELVYSYPKMANFGIKGIWSSRGCPFPCPYCFNNRYNQLYSGKGSPVRRRSVGNIIEEMKLLKENYRVDFVRMQDDVFVYKVDDWMEEFAERWPAEVGIPYYALIRSELVTDDLAKSLKKSGCFSICMSIESANDEVRKKMMRRKVEKDRLRDSFQILRNNDINVYANTMLALPFTTLETDIECVDFAIDVKPDFPNFSIFMPYPGTDLGDFCKDEGIYDPPRTTLSQKCSTRPHQWLPVSRFDRLEATLGNTSPFRGFPSPRRGPWHRLRSATDRSNVGRSIPTAVPRCRLSLPAVSPGLRRGVSSSNFRRRTLTLLRWCR